MITMKRLPRIQFLVIALSLVLVFPFVGFITKYLFASTEDYSNNFSLQHASFVTQRRGQSEDRFVYLPIVLKPFQELSYYVGSIQNLYPLGQKRGEYFSKHLDLPRGFLILSFGSAVGDDSILLYDYNTVLSLDQVRLSVINYATGIHNKIGDSSVMVRISVGVNSSGTLTREHGHNWGIMINALNSWLMDTVFNDHLTIAGGIDAETNWRSPSEARQWVQGYEETSIYYAYNFGNANDCSKDSPPTEPQWQNPPPPPSNCGVNGWTQDDVYYLSWWGPMWPLPEVYHTDGSDARRWYRIALFTYFTQNSVMVFEGSLTQYTACNQTQNPECVGANNDPWSGYYQLRNWLIADPYNRVSAPMYYATDMMWYSGIP
jgi:hypothetical protein